MIRNEAAERMRDFVRAYVRSDKRLALLDEALAAERRATVERIRARFERTGWALDARGSEQAMVDDVRVILDEEAAR